MKMNKKKIASGIICALLLGASVTHEARAAEQTIFDRKLEVDSLEFSRAVEVISKQRVYFLVPKDPIAYGNLIKGLDQIEEDIRTNKSMTLQQGWNLAYEYVSILLEKMPGQGSVLADDRQQKEIIDRLLNVNAMVPRQPRPYAQLKEKGNESLMILLREEDGEDRLARFVENAKITERTFVQDPKRVLDLFSKLAILGMGEYGGHITYGVVWNGNTLDPDYLWKQEFEALLGSLSKYPTSYLQSALDAMKKVLVGDRVAELPGKIGDLKRGLAGVDADLIGLLDLLDTSTVDKAHQRTVEKLQVRALAKKFFVKQGDVSREELNKGIRQKRQSLMNALGAFGNFFFNENAPNKFLANGAGPRIYEQIKDRPVNSARFKATARFSKALDPAAYDNVPIAGRIYRNKDKARIAYLDQLTQKGPEGLCGINWYESNNLNPTLKVQKPAKSLFDIKIIDFGKEEKGTFWDENSFSHGEVVKEVFKDYSGGIEPTLVTIDRDKPGTAGGKNDTAKIAEALTSITKGSKPTLVSMSLSFRENREVWEAFRDCLKANNIIFLAIKNEGEDLGTGQDDVAKFLDWLRVELMPDALKGLYLVSRVTHNPVLKWEKDGADYFAVLENNLVSQGFGESSNKKDLAAFIQSRGSAAGGDYYSKKYNKAVQGTSFATPAEAGAMAQVLTKLMDDGKLWSAVRAEANDIFERSLVKKNTYLRWNVDGGVNAGKAEAVEGLPLDASTFGRGMFDYENLMVQLGIVPKTSKGWALDRSTKPLPKVSEDEDQYDEIVPLRASAPDRLIRAFGGVDAASKFIETGNVSVATAEKPGFVEAISEIPTGFIKVSGVETADEAVELSEKLPGVTISGFEKLIQDSKVDVTYERFKGIKPETVAKVLQTPSNIISVTGVSVSDLPGAINLALQYGDRVSFDHSLFRDGKLGFKDLQTLDPALLGEYTKTHSVTITDVPDLKTALDLVDQGLKVAGFDEFFKDGKVSVPDLESIGAERLKKTLRYVPLKISGLSTADEAVKAAMHYKIPVDFNHPLFSSEKKLTFQEAQALDPVLLKEYIELTKGIKITDASGMNAILDFVNTLNLDHNYGTVWSLSGFSSFFESDSLSYAQFKGVDHQKLQTYMDLYKVGNIGVNGIPAEEFPHFIETMKLFRGKVTSSDLQPFFDYKAGKPVSLNEKSNLEQFGKFSQIMEGAPVSSSVFSVTVRTIDDVIKSANDPFMQKYLKAFKVPVGKQVITGWKEKTTSYITGGMFSKLVEAYPKVNLIDLSEAEIAAGDLQGILGQLPKHLKGLVLSNEAFPVDLLKNLTSFGGLETLRLAYEVEDRKDLLKKVLPALQNMKHLSLVEKSTELTDAEHKIFPVKHLEDLLKSLPNLESVRIENTSINPKVFEDLQKKGKTFDTVQSLKIPHSIVTEKSVKAILSLFPGLKELQVKGLQEGRALIKDPTKLQGLLAGRDVRVTFS